ncbi:MAG: 5'-3' exonuclease H3TH domain-containing protein [Pseudomonadota bacterium]
MIYLVDASVYIFRAYYSVPDSMTDKDGNPVNALYGYARFLGDLLETAKPRLAAVAFDESLNTSFRNDIYPEYKANRDLPPADLERQLASCRQLTEAMGLASFSSERFEADDIIGTLAVRMRERGVPSTIVTRDKDLAQLLKQGDQFWDFAGRKRYGYDEVRDQFGARPEQIADFLALAGDSVDNIPGVPGVGKKTAEALFDHFDSLDELYANLDRVVDVPVRGSGKLGSKLEIHRKIAMLSRQLTGIATDVPLDADNLEPSAPDFDALNAIYDGMGMGQTLRNQAQRIAELYG